MKAFFNKIGYYVGCVGFTLFLIQAFYKSPSESGYLELGIVSLSLLTIFKD